MINEMKKELNLCLTENGDTAYRSTMNANLDLFGVSGALRNNQEELVRLFDLAFTENELLAIKNILYLRDARGGLGERNSFRNAFRRLIDLHPETAEKLLSVIPEIGRFDDLFVCMGTPLENKMISLIDKQLKEDIANNEMGNSVSLLAKWMPSINASNKETVQMGRKLAYKLNMSERDYRKMLSSLRKGRIVENNLREKDYSFDYSGVPAGAMHKYRDAFLSNDSDRYLEFLEAVRKGEKEIHADTLYPYQIIKEARNGMSEEEKLAMQVKWDALKTGSSVSKTIVVRDGSGSMEWGTGSVLPIDIATSLAILFAEKLEGEFHNCFITFSSQPELVELKGKNLFEKLVETDNYDDCSNTDIEKVYNLILNVVKRSDFKKEDMIERIVIISDMEFDQGTTGRPTYEVFKEKFEALGYKMPEVIYWNVNARKVHYAALPDEDNIRLVSGASASIINSIIENKSVSAEDYMLLVLDKYNYIDELVNVA